MTYTDEEILQRLKLRENSNWEFKQVVFAGNEPRKPDRDRWAITISALANAKGGALLCGVTDDGELQSMTGDQLAALDHLLVQISSEAIEPPVPIRTHHREPAPGRQVLLLEVPEGNSCHWTRRGIYQRVGASSRRMKSEAILRLARQRVLTRQVQPDTWPMRGTGFETLEEDLWRPIVGPEETKPKEALSMLGLLVEDEYEKTRASVAGVLFCTSAPEKWLPHAVIKATAYRGNDRASEVIAATDIGGPLPRQVAGAMDFVMRRARASVGAKSEQAARPRYSGPAVFEALVNAVAHRDYTRWGGMTHLSMFDDRLEIQSPGSLPDGVTLDMMGARREASNPLVARILRETPVGDVPGSEHRSHFMDGRGVGVATIRRRTWECSGWYPKYEHLDDMDVRVMFPSSELQESAAEMSVSARREGKPLPGVEVLATDPDHAWERTTTDENGEATLPLHSNRHPLTVLAAADGCEAFVRENWFPNPFGLGMKLVPILEGGSVILTESEGRLPGLNGRIRVVRDGDDRVRLSGLGVTVNDDRAESVSVPFGETVMLTDDRGVALRTRVVDIRGTSVLVEYRDAEPPPDFESIEDRREARPAFPEVVAGP